MLITLDVRNVFNTASHREIVLELQERGISEYLVNLVSSYLRNRRIALEQR